MRNLLIILVISSLVGCSATGQRFEKLAVPEKGYGLIYIMRQSQLFGIALCWNVALNGKKVACVRNGGYLVKAIPLGKHELRFKNGFLEPGKEPHIEFNIIEGEIKYYEFSMSLRSMSAIGGVASMSSSKAIIEHRESSALLILENLDES